MSYSADEEYKVYNENRVRARIAHKCAACDETIAPGDIYFRIGMVSEDSASSLKRCARCQTIHLHLRDVGDWRWDNLWPDERLNCGEEYEQHWGEPPPEEVAALAFVTRDEAQSLVAANALPEPRREG